VHLVGFNIGIYYDAWTYECQKTRVLKYDDRFIITIPVYCWMLEYAFVSASSPVPLCVRPVEPSPLMEAMVLSGEPVSPPRAMLVTGLNELPPEVWPASDPVNTHAQVHFVPLLSTQ
jgi:hypothetical protein